MGKSFSLVFLLLAMWVVTACGSSSRPASRSRISRPVVPTAPSMKTVTLIVSNPEQPRRHSRRSPSRSFSRRARPRRSCAPSARWPVAPSTPNPPAARPVLLVFEKMRQLELADEKDPFSKLSPEEQKLVEKKLAPPPTKS